ncbi:DNA replication factor Cdt1 [Aplysia californica]|uniref:DNA replication factor Cdt1 n=1 Tax=Aplysia californica TaxID=6500 RepID=A0ABM0JY09_APLCA|nr:DNA replication factor Cdt1 [Aplysia californica]
MAQARVNDFFCAKKKSDDVHPAKRRKLDSVNSKSTRSQVSKSKSLTFFSDRVDEDGSSKTVLDSVNVNEAARMLASPLDGSAIVKPDVADSSLDLVPASNINEFTTNRSSSPSSEVKHIQKQVLLRQPSSRSSKSRTSRSRTSSKKSTPSVSSRSKISSRTTRNTACDKSQRKLTDLVLSKANTSVSDDATCARELAVSSSVEHQVIDEPNEFLTCDIANFEEIKLTQDDKPSSSSENTSKCMEEITSVADDHDRAISGMSTPRKRIMNWDHDDTNGPKTRHKKTAPRRLSDEAKQGCQFESAKKKLELSPSTKSRSSTSTRVKVKEPVLAESTDVITKSSPVSPEDENIKETFEAVNGKSSLIALVSTIVPPPSALSPLSRTPERLEEDSPPSPKPMPPKLENLSQKLKVLSKMNGQALKNRLKQNGKLGDLKERLGELNKAVADTKKERVAVEDIPKAKAQEDASEKSVPAYQRFEHLAADGPPTLSLPFAYRLLDNAFQAMDTVVSMMHNRSEMCTFSKLRAAVQNMTKKNFEQKTAGQIKTITPEAYTFRQEKNVPAFGKKVSGYQLTVEPNLGNKDAGTDTEMGQTNSEGKPVFTASMLLKRKNDFKKRLVDRVKQHHKTFLSSLSPPIVIPDDKITRWHPRFQLDKVPEVAVSPLPQPPEVLVYHSAKDVLEKQRGKLNPRVEAALSRVADANKTSETEHVKQNSTPSTSSSQSSVSSSSSPSSSQNTPSLKGIPPALLAKIRAKEALKMQEAMTRDPAEDDKTRMMGHLPDIIRIIRSYFVTEKKPALPLDSVYKKLQESYKSGISLRDVEQHISLLKELAPELLSVVEIKRGKYVKLDKNVDTQAISSRILNQVKARK